MGDDRRSVALLPRTPSLLCVLSKSYELFHLTENDDPSELRLLGVASVVPLSDMVISSAGKLESVPLVPAASMTAEPVYDTWPKLASGTSLQKRTVHDDGASAITSAEDRANPLPVCVVENVQPAVASLISSVNDVPADFAATSAV